MHFLIVLQKEIVYRMITYLVGAAALGLNVKDLEYPAMVLPATLMQTTK
jgi:hypothetical protein